MEERPLGVLPSNAECGRRRWRFAGATLDERTLELTVNGVDTELERKPLEVLTYLLQHAGEVCTKDELLAGVWPGRVLSETVLTKCIGRLRDALGDRDQDIIKTAYGFGYRFVAPVQVESIPQSEPPRFDFRPGDRLPNRPLWSLVERLGVGGHGEAWRARHDKTHEQRVFKFALDETSLGALKREITLFRVINDTLGESARVARLLDWNLEQLPYFIEAEYVPGGNLLDWVKTRGGVAAIPLAERLEIVASIADALAAVHSVGVLHKDLKPSNVLVRPLPSGSVEILLADFGSGGVLDTNHIDRLGITRLGFTKTIAVSETSSGTPMYLAPEILVGQPFTVKTDIYALGVMLYQFISGDFHKVMSPGWERDITDELLREDIALLAEGNPAMRLGDVENVARRLRALPERRTELVQKREAEARAQRTRQLLDRARARRLGLLIAFATLIVGLGVSTALFLRARDAQQRSEAAAARARAVTEFLSKDVFAPMSSGAESVKDLRVTELLMRAGAQIDHRFATQPDVASELHYVIARSLNEFYETGPAVEHFNRALTLGKELRGEGSEAAMRSAAELIILDSALGNLDKTMPTYEKTLQAGANTLEPSNTWLLQLREQMAFGNYLLGHWAKSASQLRAILTDLERWRPKDDAPNGRAHSLLGQTLVALGQPQAAQEQLRLAIPLLSKAFGEKHPEVTEARGALGRALTDSGRYAEADTQLRQAEQYAVEWAKIRTWTVIRPRYFRALLYIETGEPVLARPLLTDVIDYQDAHTGEHPELDYTGSLRQALAETYLRQGDTRTAITMLEKAVRVSSLADGPAHPITQSIRLSLAEALLTAGGASASQPSVAEALASRFPDLPEAHPYLAQLNWVKALDALHRQDIQEARESLRQTLSICETLYGPGHWRTLRVRQELQRITN